jgi:hypothetical protein
MNYPSPCPHGLYQFCESLVSLHFLFIQRPKKLSVHVDSYILTLYSHGPVILVSISPPPFLFRREGQSILAVGTTTRLMPNVPLVDLNAHCSVALFGPRIYFGHQKSLTRVHTCVFTKAIYRTAASKGESGR